MSYWQDIWRIVRSSKSSTYRSRDGNTVLRHGTRFSGLSITSAKEIAQIISDKQYDIMQEFAGGARFDTPEDIRKSSEAAVAPIASYRVGGANAPRETVKRVLDSIVGADFNYIPGIPIPGDNLNTAPNFAGMPSPNLWIDPAEAALIYASGGLSSHIINKKAKSVAYNGARIVNPELTKSEMERVNEESEKTGLVKALSDGERDGLVYGGSIVFPMFRKDVPATMLMDVKTLSKLGIIEKGCIERYVVLDRNNAVIIPNWNPTAADFLDPREYYVPYLGSDVSGQRVARVVPLPQAGYWGAIMSMGWGISDIQNWYKAVTDYEAVAHALPSMIRQMSILIRTFNVDLANALNGAVTLDNMELEMTQAMHRASNEDPITMDVIGDVKAVERDFTAVAELTRVVRQNVGMKANIPEEMLWSSDRGAFSSGDQWDGLSERQWEGIKFINDELAARSKNLAMLEVINALGKDRRILSALAATRIELLPPKIENADKRATLIKNLAEGTFNFIASGMQLDSALSLVLPYGDEHLVPTEEVIRKIQEHQKEVDEQTQRDHDLDAALKQKQLDAPDAAPAQGAPQKSSSASSDKESGYSKLEQRMHEKVRQTGPEREGLQRAEGKKL